MDQSTAFELCPSHQQLNKSDQQNFCFFSSMSVSFLKLYRWRLLGCLCYCCSFFIFFLVFNVRSDSYSEAIKTAVSDVHHMFALMMNGCWVRWFYGPWRFVSPAAGRLVECDWAWGQHTEVMQLLAVTLTASHPAHLSTWGSHKTPLARRTQSL